MAGWLDMSHERKFWLVIWALVFIITFALVSAALAHEAYTGWTYPSSCCSDKDCSAIAATRVKVRPDGYWFDDYFLIPFSEARKSPDSDYHACKNNVLLYGNGKPCFWAPPGLM